MANVEKLILLLLRYAEVYNATPSEAVVEIYCDLLAPYPLDAVERAIRAHLGDPHHGSWFFKPADLLRWLERDTEAEAYAMCAAVMAGAPANTLAGQVYESLGGGAVLERLLLKDSLRYRDMFASRYQAACREASRERHGLTALSGEKQERPAFPCSDRGSDGDEEEDTDA